jgi:hypothetical protein
MTAVSVLGALAVAGIAAASDYGLFATAWVAAGIASAALYYPPAFAGPLGWRGTYLVLADMLAAVTVLAHALLLRLPRQYPVSPGQAVPARGAARSVLASRTFLLLVTAATLGAFAQYAALVDLVPLLTGRGMSPGLAAWALALGGAGQIAGRLCYRRPASWSGNPRPDRGHHRGRCRGRAAARAAARADRASRRGIGAGGRGPRRVQCAADRRRGDGAQHRRGHRRRRGQTGGSSRG